MARKPTGCATAIGIVVLALIIGKTFSGLFADNPPPAVAAAKPTETPEQIATKKKQDAAVQRAATVAALLKKTMRDPDSFSLESAVIVAETGAACYTYRAKNGFGGTNVATAVLSGDAKTFKTSEMDGFTKIWNKECANRYGTDAATRIKRSVL